MQFLTDLFNCRNITESSKNIYQRNLIKLNSGRPVNNLRFLSNHDAVLQKIKDYKPNTQRTYVIAIVSALKCLLESKPTKAAQKLHESWSAVLEKYNSALKNATAKKDNEKENWMEYSDVQTKYDELKREALALRGKRSLTPALLEKIMNAVLLGLYVEHPPRRNRDYQKMVVVKTLPDDTDKDLNYLVLKNKEFVFNNYKTRGAYDTQKFPVGNDFMKLLRIWLRVHPGKDSQPFYLLVDSAGKPLKHVNSITTRLNKLFGKRIGSSMLRKLYATSKYGSKLDELADDAKAMGTSVEVLKDNYIKAD